MTYQWKKLLNGIMEFKLTQKRMEIIKGIRGSTIINDCYNASYDSMKAAIEYLSTLKGRKIAVLGDMLELGKFEKELHEKVGEEIYKNNIDVLITIGNLAKDIANKANNLGMPKQNIFIYDTKEKGIEKLKDIVKNNDYILIKASNSMKFYDITNAIKEE